MPSTAQIAAKLMRTIQARLRMIMAAQPVTRPGVFRITSRTAS
jgi:hypothetical protein